MKRWWFIGGALVLLAVLVGGMWRQQWVCRPARSAASINPADEQAESKGAEGLALTRSAASIKPADEQAMRHLQNLLSTWKGNAQEPARSKP